MNPNLISESLQQLITQFLAYLPNLLAALVIFFASLFLAGIFSQGVTKALRLRKVTLEISLAVETLVRWTVIILGTATALSQIGFDLTAFLAGVGVVGFTVGFALQDVSKNFVAGLLLLLQQPFNLEDTIEVAGYSGTVLKVDLRATTLRTLDGRLVQIPNGEVFTRPIVNFSRGRQRRIELQVVVVDGTNLEKARTEGLAALKTIPGVLGDPAPRAVFQMFGASGIQMTFYYWVDTTITDPLDAQDAGMVNIDKAFKEAKIEIPFPVSIVYTREPKG